MRDMTKSTARGKRTRTVGIMDEVVDAPSTRKREDDFDSTIQRLQEEVHHALIAHMLILKAIIT